MGLTTDDLCNAIRACRRDSWEPTIGNLCDKLGLGESQEDYVRIHELILQGLKENKVTYDAFGEYNIHGSQPLVPINPIADPMYREVLSEALSEFRECEPHGQPTE